MKFNDGPQPVTDFGRPADGIHNLARNPVTPNQIAAGRLCVEGAIVCCGRANLGRLCGKALFDELRGSHFHESRRDRRSVLGVILCAEKAAWPGSLCGYRLNGGELVGGQNLRVRWQRFDLVNVRA